MPPTDTTTRLKTAFLEQAILSFGDRGFNGISTFDIAEAAGSNETSLFRLFGTKKNLFHMAVSHVVTRMHASMGEVLFSVRSSDESDPRIQIADIVRGWYEALQPKDARLLQQVLKQFNPNDAALREQAHATIYQIIAAVSREFQRLKAKDAALGVELLIWGLFELKILQRAAKPSKEEERRVNALIEYLVSAALSKT